MSQVAGEAPVALANAKASVDIAPDRGAAITRYDCVTPKGVHPVLVPVDGIANFPLAPWQNRVSGGGFTHRGRFIALAPNVRGEPFPIHGNAWQQSWRVTQQTGETATLALRSEGPGIYRYRATMDFALGANGALTIALKISNEGPELPFGLGFHPYFPRTAVTTLTAIASTVTLQGKDHMPTDTVQTNERPNLQFAEPRVLPAYPINNEFGGWNGVADVRWPDRGLGCRLEAPGLTRYVVYSPDCAAGFFCFEPVTHVIDAFNRHPGTHGLVTLQRKAKIGVSMVLTPYIFS